MTKDEIMKMDDHELLMKVWDWADKDGTTPFPNKLADQLYLCYQAEEKIKEMGEEMWMKYGAYLSHNYPVKDVIEDHADIANVAHLYPRPRAQAILLTVEGV
jgi:hypothetical protein